MEILENLSKLILVDFNFRINSQTDLWKTHPFFFQIFNLPYELDQCWQRHPYLLDGRMTFPEIGWVHDQKFEYLFIF